MDDKELLLGKCNIPTWDDAVAAAILLEDHAFLVACGAADTLSEEDKRWLEGFVEEAKPLLDFVAVFYGKPKCTSNPNARELATHAANIRAQASA